MSQKPPSCLLLYANLVHLPTMHCVAPSFFLQRIGVTIQHSVDVVRLLIFSYMKYKSHLTFFFSS